MSIAGTLSECGCLEPGTCESHGNVLDAGYVCPSCQSENLTWAFGIQPLSTVIVQSCQDCSEELWVLDTVEEYQATKARFL